MNVVLYPLDRVELDGKTIFLGMDWAAAEQVLGRGTRVRGRHCYFGSELAIDCDADNRVCFIEFLGGVDGKLKPVIYGVSAFDVDAEELVELLRRKNNGPVDSDPLGDYSHSFLSISVGVYRPLTPADVLEMEEDMRKEGISTEGNVDLERDRRNAAHWAAIWIGIEGYYE